MKRLAKTCFPFSDAGVEQPRLIRASEQTSEAPSEPVSEPQMDSNSSEQANFQVLGAKKHNNAFSVKNARFLPGGDLHSIVISFDKEGGTKMKLTIDDKMIYHVDGKRKFRGNTELNIEGLAVDFFWDLVRIPTKFSFRTREFSFHASAGESSRRGAGKGEQWKDHGQAFLLEILGV